MALYDLDGRYLDPSEVEARTDWRSLTNENTPAKLATLKGDLYRQT